MQEDDWGIGKLGMQEDDIGAWKMISCIGR